MTKDITAQYTSFQAYTLKPSGKAPNDRQQIQAVLNRARNLTEGECMEVRLESGTFRIDQCLVVYSNTRLILKPDTVMLRANEYRIMLKSYTDKKTPGYGNAHDIVIDGGIWDGASTTTDKYKKLIKFSHARNITVRNATIRRVSGKHCMTFAAIDGVRVQNVHFTEFVGYTDTERRRANAEQLHIDGISDDGVSEPNEQPYDNTPCRDVVIEDCVFDGGYAAIGSHYPPFKGHGDGFTVRRCIFRNYQYPPIHVFHFDEICIKENLYINCAVGECGEPKPKWRVLLANAFTAIKGNAPIRATMTGSEEIMDGVRLYNCAKVQIQDNKEENT